MMITFTMTLNDHPITQKASIYHGVLGWLIFMTTWYGG
jgi:hypothetical protein